LTDDDLTQRVSELLARWPEELWAFTCFDNREATRASGLAGELSEVAAASSVKDAIDQAFELVENDLASITRYE
jgi:hypothetical protein